MTKILRGGEFNQLWRLCLHLSYIAFLCADSIRINNHNHVFQKQYIYTFPPSRSCLPLIASKKQFPPSRTKIKSMNLISYSNTVKLNNFLQTFNCPPMYCSTAEPGMCTGRRRVRGRSRVRVCIGRKSWKTTKYFVKYFTFSTRPVFNTFPLALHWSCDNNYI